MLTRPLSLSLLLLGIFASTASAQPPTDFGPGMITPGSTWNFQFWYRDPTSPGPDVFNLSGGWTTTFSP